MATKVARISPTKPVNLPHLPVVHLIHFDGRGGVVAEAEGSALLLELKLAFGQGGRVHVSFLLDKVAKCERGGRVIALVRKKGLAWNAPLRACTGKTSLASFSSVATKKEHTTRCEKHMTVDQRKEKTESCLFRILKLTLHGLGLGRRATPARCLHCLQQLPRAAGVAVPLEQQADPVGLCARTQGRRSHINDG